MKLTLTIGESESVIEFSREGAFRVGDGVQRTADVEQPEPGVYSVILSGRSYQVRVEPLPDGVTVTVGGRRFEIGVSDPRRWSRGARAHGGAGVQNIVSPMPGKIVRVLVGVGDEVQAGQGIIVMEAMKMQNEMKAKRAGKVLGITAREGATVTAGEVLAAIE